MLLLNRWNGLKGHFAEIELKHQNFLNINTGEWYLTVSFFNYWNDLVLGSVETYFHEVGAYTCLKQATAGV